jgi:hypothetical protein
MREKRQTHQKTNPPLEEKMFYFQDVLRLPGRCFISQKKKSFENILKMF